MSVVPQIVKYTRLAWGLRSFLRSQITLEESKRVLSNRLSHRLSNFLSLVQKGIYQNPKSPYLKLLQIAGCEFGDIESLVNQEGIETTLQKLLAEGVYLTWEEFKGKKEVVRGGHHLVFKQRDFDNPFLPVYYQAQSGGTRSAGTRTIFDVDRQADMSYYRLIMLVDKNAMDVPFGLWKPMLPAPAGVSNVLTQWKIGKPVDRWFSPVDERQIESPLEHRLAMIYIIYGSRFWGVKLAKPEYVGFSEAARVAQWMGDNKQQFGGCSLDCYVSPAVKVCQAALEKGIDINNAQFFVGGEALSPAKRQQIQAAGASVTPKYNISEIGRIGCGCSEAGATDDVHLFLDSMAVIQYQRKVEHTDVHVNAFLFTPLLPSSTKILLNLESGDYGVMETRNCACMFGQLGFNTHLHDIRSFDKLTGSGMTIIDTDFLRILEEVLPDKYGGAATDYQLLEEEDSQGHTNLSLIINPTVGVLDEQDVIDTVLQELRRNPHPGKLAAGFWSQAKIFRVKRMEPITKFSKVTTLHLRKTA